MAWPKGKPRPEGAGRKKGTLNIKTAALEAICEQHKINPFEAMIILAVTTEKEELRFNALKELCQYLYPKRKAVEVSNSSEEGFKIILEDYIVKKDA
jgi:hypothetical protein